MQEPNHFHDQLLNQLKKSIEIWFLSKNDDHAISNDIQDGLCSSIKAILLNGLKPEGAANSYQQFANDLNWLHTSTTSNATLLNTSSTTLLQLNNSDSSNNDLLSLWIMNNLEMNNLCSRLQMLTADKELLENYFTSYAFIRNDNYSTAMFICISAFELKQSSLLSQIDYQQQHNKSMFISKKHRHHKRSSSHPHFSISPKKSDSSSSTKQNQLNSLDSPVKCLAAPTAIADSIKTNKINNLMFNRKWKSLPIIAENFCTQQTVRPRSKTFSQPINIPFSSSNYKQQQPCKLNLTNISNYSTDSQKSAPEFIYRQQQYFSSNTASTSASDCNNTTCNNNKISNLKNQPTKTIKCIKCDDIKIHLDRNYLSKQQSSANSVESTTSSSPLTSKQSSKGLSPINFLSSISANIFSPKSFDENIVIWPTNKNDIISSSSSTNAFHSDVFGSFSTRDGEKLIKHNNFLEDLSTLDNKQQDELSRLSNIEEQNLSTFLQSNLFSRNNTTDLERENAHFKISETIISLIEQIKWTKSFEKNMIEVKNETGREMQNDKKEKIIKKKRKINKKEANKNMIAVGEAVETATSYLDVSKDTDTIYYARSASEDDCSDDQNLNETDDHVAYAEWGTNLNAFSAEGVALSLISKFSDQQLPKVSELKWLVSEEDAPQKLLPMPDLSSENPDDHVIHSFTRGTRDWAPPRQQIIFTNHPPINRKLQMQNQNYRCAGCGMRVAPIYMSRFRYCTYLGKYHCTGCHRNHISSIPAKVLSNWNFTLYPVSVFSYRLLEQIWTFPLFHVSDLSPTLYRRVKSLNMTKYRRNQLKFLKDFITTCRFADNEIKLFKEIPLYLSTDPDKWSMSDFIDTKSGKLIKVLNDLIESCEKHVFNCVLCTARGFLCEFCHQEQVIYPWQSTVKRCEKCGTCFHKKCCKQSTTENTANIDCLKCQRLKKREQKLNEQFSSSITNAELL